ncbi:MULTISPECIES: DUF4232 domain-containing protein [unclassified Frankia]|uniref:DUF4232 domain-containing protein n=1 Tax=unclassified Frankia TaxID=2632575 RepID=UPI002AD3FC1B|nr:MULTISPECIES: DUF4232 domain-containing protein [unclassified Frankia]
MHRHLDRVPRRKVLLLVLPLVAASCGGSAGAVHSAATPPSAVSAGSTITRCAMAGLTVTLGTVTTVAASQRQIPVTFTNRSATRCSMYGFPGAQLLSANGATYDIPRSPLVSSTRIVLAPGANAHATLTYLADDTASSSDFAATRLGITPPDERSSTVLPWTYGPIVNQEGATHPGTYIMALTPGA